MTQFFVQLLQSQLSAVQGGAGDARVLIEADPDSSGGLRYMNLKLKLKKKKCFLLLIEPVLWNTLDVVPG